VTCENCDGIGSKVCSQCQGTGRHQCSECNGSANISCPKCKGNGTLACGTVVTDYTCRECGYTTSKPIKSCPICPPKK
jgi:hypothetical protein